MEKLIRGQRSKINGLYDDPIAESDYFCIALDEVIKPLDVDPRIVKEIDEALIAASKYPVPTKGYDNSIQRKIFSKCNEGENNEVNA